MTLSLTSNQGFVCCEYSQQVGEPLFATATSVDVWLLLEQRLPWGKEAFAESTLPESVKNHLSTALDTIPGSRLQFIRQPSRHQKPGVMFFVALSSEENATLYRFELAACEELLQLDLPAIAAADIRYQSHQREEPIFLVCTNGRRDVACAKYGTPVYDALTKVAPDATWQTTHLGGHRFAATSVLLPHGLCYGRLTIDQVTTVVDEYRLNQIVLDVYRGRCFQDEPLQAAEYFLRQQTGNRLLNGLRVVEVQNLNSQRWRIEFDSRPDGVRYQVDIEQFMSEFTTYKNSTDTAPTQVPQYRLLGYELIAN